MIIIPINRLLMIIAHVLMSCCIIVGLTVNKVSESSSKSSSGHPNFIMKRLRVLKDYALMSDGNRSMDLEHDGN